MTVKKRKAKAKVSEKQLKAKLKTAEAKLKKAIRNGQSILMTLWKLPLHLLKASQCKRLVFRYGILLIPEATNSILTMCH